MRRGSLACLLVLGLGACGASTTAGHRSPGPTPVTRQAAPPPRPKLRPKPKPTPKPKPDPGSLPQTHQLPSSHSPAFRSEMAALWRGVTTGSVRAALPAFFPQAAYAQVKQIADPGADWVNRLVAEYRLDIAAAHGMLGGDGAGARLLGVRVPAGYVHWVNPGACYNRVGYYEVPNSRLVYRRHGQVRSFGIASLISWRGAWYVVHLGAVVRPGPAGVVDAPSLGTGAAAPSSTC